MTRISRFLIHTLFIENSENYELRIKISDKNF